MSLRRIRVSMTLAALAAMAVALPAAAAAVAYAVVVPAAGAAPTPRALPPKVVPLAVAVRTRSGVRPQTASSATRRNRHR
jgi:hypothetical protein